jgi:hypothetical protein
VSAVERIGRLGRRVFASRSVSARRGGARLARSVALRHRPPLLESATRLARVRRVDRRRAGRVAAAPQQHVADPGLSDFALRWMFGDGDVAAMPGSGGALPAVDGPPTFLAAPEPPAHPVAPEPRTVVPGRFEEFGPFRLSRTPAPQAPEPVETAPEGAFEGGHGGALEPPPVVPAAEEPFERPRDLPAEAEVPNSEPRRGKPADVVMRDTAPSAQAPPSQPPPQPLSIRRTAAASGAPSRPHVQRRVLEQPPLSPASPEIPVRLAERAAPGLLRRSVAAVLGRVPTPMPTRAAKQHSRSVEPPAKVEAAAPPPAKVEAATPPPARGIMRVFRRNEPADAAEVAEVTTPPAQPVEPPGNAQPVAAVPSRRRMLRVFRDAEQSGEEAAEPEPEPTAAEAAEPPPAAEPAAPAPAAEAAATPPAADESVGAPPVAEPVSVLEPVEEPGESGPSHELVIEPVRPVLDAAPGNSTTEPARTPRRALTRAAAVIRRKERATAAAASARSRTPGATELEAGLPESGADAAEPPLPRARAAVPDDGTQIEPVPVRLVPAPSAAAREKLPISPIARRTSARSLAAATGARPARKTTELATVSFPAPDREPPDHPSMRAASAATEPFVARQADAEASAPAEPAAAPAPAPAAPSAAHGSTGDLDEIYDHVVTRLRRDLLREREQMGDLLGDLY